MIDQTKVFISSSMTELREERAIVHELILAMDGFDPYAYELDAVASNTDPKELWETTLDKAAVCLVILWKKLGKWTVDEIERALANGSAVLVFVRTEDTDGDGIAEVATSEVADYLRSHNRPADADFSERRFEAPTELNRWVKESLIELTRRSIEVANKVHRQKRIDAAAELAGTNKTATTLDRPEGGTVDESRGASRVSRPVEERPRIDLFPHPFLGRSFEKNALAGMIRQKQKFLPITGLDEVGRKSLLQLMAHEEFSSGEFAERFPDGAGLRPEIRASAVVPDGAEPLPGEADVADHDEGLGDILQAIWETSYTLGPGGEVADGAAHGLDVHQRAKDLKQLKGLVALFDVDLTREQADALVQALPESVIAATMADDADLGQHRPLPMQPMKGDELVEAFETQTFISVPEALRDQIAAAFASTEGRPAQVAALANDAVKAGVRPDSLGEWLATIGSK